MTRKPNVLLLVLDSVRARNTSLHGHVNETTPFLERFAEDAIVYDQARSPSVSSRPSHASLFTGYHAAEHNLRDGRELRPGVTIWEELQDAHDIRTGVFSHNPFLSPGSYGLVRGFDTTRTSPTDFVDLPFRDGLDPYGTEGIASMQEGIDHALSHDRPVKSLLNGLYMKAGKSLPMTAINSFEPTADVYVESFFDWVRETVSKRPWAACLNLMDAHYPYEPEAKFDDWGGDPLRDLQDEWGEAGYDADELFDGDRPWWQLRAFESLYDGAIRQLDHYVERIVSFLKRTGEYEDTYLVITSDHGECFGEASHFDSTFRTALHGPDGGIHECLVHVPLLVKPPGDDYTPGRVSRVASLTEFASSVRDALAGDLSRRSLLPDDRVFVTMPQQHDPTCLAVYEDTPDGVEAKMLWGEKTVEGVVYDAQQSYLSTETKVEDLLTVRDRFRDRDVSTDSADPLSDEVTQQLADLGYV